MITKHCQKTSRGEYRSYLCLQRGSTPPFRSDGCLATESFGHLAQEYASHVGRQKSMPHIVIQLHGRIPNRYVARGKRAAQIRAKA